MVVFLKLNSVSKPAHSKGIQDVFFGSLSRTFYIDAFIFFLLFSDHALVGHGMSTASVVDEFECQLKCIGNNSCKSFNTHLDGSSAKRLQCELNSKTRQTNPGDFKWSKGSTYYGSVQVSVFLLKEQSPF